MRSKVMRQRSSPNPSPLPDEATLSRLSSTGDQMAESPPLRTFLVHLATERGLSDNTLAAYRRDLADLGKFLSRRGRTFLTTDGAELREYLRSQSKLGQSTATVSRR